jgi:hypothetical protein
MSDVAVGVLNCIMSVVGWLILVLAVTGFVALACAVVWILCSEIRDFKRKRRADDA